MNPPGAEIPARTLSTGRAEGELLVLQAPLSFWGGMDGETGEVIDQRHPQLGIILTGKIVVMPAGRGSSSSSSVLAEAIRLGSAPLGLVLQEPDGIIALGAMVAAELYGKECPVVWVAGVDYARLRSGVSARICADDEGATIHVMASR